MTFIREMSKALETLVATVNRELGPESPGNADVNSSGGMYDGSIMS